jgi:predicted amidohydrolase YtcJ
LDDADVAGKKLGDDRAERESYLFKLLLNSNALVALGSDWPVSMLELLVHLYCVLLLPLSPI